MKKWGGRVSLRRTEAPAGEGARNARRGTLRRHRGGGGFLSVGGGAGDTHQVAAHAGEDVRQARVDLVELHAKKRPPCRARVPHGPPTPEPQPRPPPPRPPPRHHAPCPRARTPPRPSLEPPPARPRPLRSRGQEASAGGEGEGSGKAGGCGRAGRARGGHGRGGGKGGRRGQGRGRGRGAVAGRPPGAARGPIGVLTTCRAQIFLRPQRRGGVGGGCLQQPALRRLRQVAPPRMTRPTRRGG